MEIQIGTPLSIREAFELAVSEARKGLGFVSPNPPVGCVVLDRHGNFLSSGYHQRFGGPHAEVEAINKITDPSLLKGAVVIVTLEPCAHHGKTPPCAEMLAKLPLSEVHYGLKDPNPLVAGKGIEVLRKAGIEVVTAPSEMQIALELLVESFLTNQKYKECFVGVKAASSLDGMMCLENRESQWITSEAARLQGHRLRAQYGAVLTSANSLINDNSRLNARVAPFENKSIPVFILDEQGRCGEFLPKSNLLSLREPSEIFVFTFKEHLTKCKGLPSSQLIEMEPNDEGLFRLDEVFRRIWDLNTASVMVEAGPQLTSALVSQGLFHRLELFIGNKILGANSTGSWTKGLMPSRMDETISLKHIRFQTFGEDLLVSGRNPSSFQPLFFQA